MSQYTQSHFAKFTLDEWLSYLENLHSTEIDLGLGRISKVAAKLAFDFSNTKVITVAGTNGKGTTCAFLENALLAEGKSVAVYSSPHIERFNERLRINKVDISDAPLIKAFEKIEALRGDISLSYYEYTTLVALLVLQQDLPDYLLLEVGLGGRLDATNIIDADIAVLTSVDLDHQAFLGDTREKIGFEKAGIFRAEQIAIVGDLKPPQSVIEHARSLGTECYYRDQDFLLCEQESQEANLWQWQFEHYKLENLIAPHIPRDNIATALAVLAKLNIEFNADKINRVIAETKVAGRTEIFKQDCDIMLDVGHNPHAAKYLATTIANKQYNNVYAVLGMLADKDVVSVVKPMLNVVTHWNIGGLSVPRGQSSVQIAELIAPQTSNFDCFDNICDAFKMATQMAKQDDLVLVFGSFFTVAEVRRLLV